MTADSKDRRLIPFLIFSIIFADQLSKYLLQKLGLISGCNEGIAFGIGHLNPIVSVIIIGVVLVLLVKETNFVFKLGLALILAGGFSNFADRVFLGCVRDFISIYNFPSFNIADSAITLGAGTLIYIRSQKSQRS